MVRGGNMMNQFEIIMQYNPYEDEGINLETLNKQIDFVWDDYTIDNYNFLVLSHTDKPAYMQLKIDEDAFYVVEVLENEVLHQIKLDEKSTVKSLFKGYFNNFDLDFSVFENITNKI